MLNSTGETPVSDSLAQLILFWESKAEGRWDFRHTSLISFFLGVVFVAHCSVCSCFGSHSEERRRERRWLTRGCGLCFRSRCLPLQSQALQRWVSLCLRPFAWHTSTSLIWDTHKVKMERQCLSHPFHLLCISGLRFTLNSSALPLSGHSRLRQPHPVTGSVTRQAGRVQGWTSAMSNSENLMSFRHAKFPDETVLSSCWVTGTLPALLNHHFPPLPPPRARSFLCVLGLGSIKYSNARLT